MWNDFGEFIENLSKNKKTKIAEIAIGKYDGIFNYLNSKDNIEIIKTDINPTNDSIIYDDIKNPQITLYEDCDIIYSIRPPSEIQPYLIELNKKINAILIIKPLFNEDINSKNYPMKLKNYKKASFYISY